MAQYSDEELMILVKEQDITAFEELLGRYERRVFAFFYRLLWNTEDARDCTQETFFRLWRGRAMYAPTGKFTTYIFQIARNYFLHEHEKNKRRITFNRSSDNELPAPAENLALVGSAFEQAIANELGTAISRAITSLPEPHRLVYVLSEEQRLSYKEIAEVLDCPVGTVSSRKVEAVRKLRKLLEPLKDECLGKDTHNREMSK